jgi:hypothetical protein
VPSDPFVPTPSLILDLGLKRLGNRRPPKVPQTYERIHDEERADNQNDEQNEVETGDQRDCADGNKKDPHR